MAQCPESTLRVTVDLTQAERDLLRLDALTKRIEARIGRISQALVARPGDAVVLLVPPDSPAELFEVLRADWAEYLPDVRLVIVPIADARFT